MAFKLWQRASSPDVAAALLVARIVTALGALALFYLARRFYYEVDPRFVPGVTAGPMTNPQFVLAALILTPAALVLLVSTARSATCWIAALLIICVAALEGFAYLYNNRVVASAAGLAMVQKWQGDSIQNTECGKIAACLFPNAHAHAVGTVGEKTVFEADYNTDESKVRRSLNKDDELPRPTFVSVFGDSNTFGMNVSDQQTLSGQIGAIACSAHPYNLAFPGGTTSNMLAEFEEHRISDVIKQTKGYFVYVYNDGHPIRNVGNDGMILYFGKNFPAYDFDGDGSISYKGTLWTYRVFSNAFVVLGQHSNVLAALNIHPLNIETSYHTKLTAAIIDRSAQLAREQFPDSKFVLLFAPGTPSRPRLDLAAQLHDKDIRILDYSGLIPRTLAGTHMPDGHPTPIFHRIVAEELSKIWDWTCIAGQRVETISGAICTQTTRQKGRHFCRPNLVEKSETDEISISKPLGCCPSQSGS
jgi:hypothetical protein